MSQLAALGSSSAGVAGAGSVPTPGAGLELAGQRGRNTGPCVLLAALLHPEQGPCCLCGDTGQGYLAGGTKQCGWGGESLRNAKAGGRVVRKALLCPWCCGGESPGRDLQSFSDCTAPLMETPVLGSVSQ